MIAIMDTDTCIDILRGRPSRAPERIMSAGIGRVAISSITYHELLIGLQKVSSPQKLRSFQSFIEVIRIMSFDANAAKQSAVLRGGLDGAGKGIGVMDSLIAGHAISLKLPLVTSNTRHFQRVPNLKLENWRK